MQKQRKLKNLKFWKTTLNVAREQNAAGGKSCSVDVYGVMASRSNVVLQEVLCCLGSEPPTALPVDHTANIAAEIPSIPSESWGLELQEGSHSGFQWLVLGRTTFVSKRKNFVRKRSIDDVPSRSMMKSTIGIQAS